MLDINKQAKNLFVGLFFVQNYVFYEQGLVIAFLIILPFLPVYVGIPEPLILEALNCVAYPTAIQLCNISIIVIKTVKLSKKIMNNISILVGGLPVLRMCP